MDKKEIVTGILGIICLAYGVIVYRVQSGTSTYLLWIALAIFFLALTVGIHVQLWVKIPQTIRRITVVIVSLAILIFVTVEGCIVSGFFAKGSDHLDYIIVLGAQVYENGPSNVLRYRLDAAYDYLTDNEDTICIVSGGQGTNEPCAEAQVMYEYLVKKGVAAERILMETESLNTVENLKYSSAYFDMETDSVGIVTNNFHIFRSTHLAKALGMKHVCGIAAGMNPLYLPNNMLREFFGVVKDLLCGNLIGTQEAQTQNMDGAEAKEAAADIATAEMTEADTSTVVEPDTAAAETNAAAETEKIGILQFVDVYGQQYETEILNSVEKHIYDWTNLIWDGDRVSYEDETYTSRLGIDVSYYQGDIDWEKVKADGVTFAFIRIGYRGYGESGVLCEDTRALENIKEAQQVGIDVGVYFFSQAINEEEALEEAEFVIEKLQGIELELPVVYDPESILDDDARTDDVSGEQFTKNTIVFTERIREAGYEAMIYSNMLWEAFEFQLDVLSNLEIWYADYEEIPQTPYHFTFWQYTNSGSVDGIDGTVDLDIQLFGRI